MNFALLAKELDVKHYGLLSSTGADATSIFLYMKTKGRVEQALKDLKLSQLSIYRPGLLLNRRNDSRVGEKIGSWIPFITKIESADMGKAMVEHAVKVVRMSDAELADHRIHEMNNAQIIADLRANVKL